MAKVRPALAQAAHVLRLPPREPENIRGPLHRIHGKFAGTPDRAQLWQERQLCTAPPLAIVRLSRLFDKTSGIRLRALFEVRLGTRFREEAALVVHSRHPTRWHAPLVSDERARASQFGFRALFVLRPRRAMAARVSGPRSASGQDTHYPPWGKPHRRTGLAPTFRPAVAPRSDFALAPDTTYARQTTRSRISNLVTKRPKGP